MKFTSIFVASATFVVLAAALPQVIIARRNAEPEGVTIWGRSVFQRRQLAVRVAEADADPDCTGPNCVCGRPGAPLCWKDKRGELQFVREAAPEPVAEADADPDCTGPNCVCGRPGAPLCWKNKRGELEFVKV
ncbi:hypothetical protein P167DRAFT_575461 [Morchella conica CCBAS932]|uniref:Uncharacterized protein n=1 Tax=Morchella conica CCBAS932 TaxID=1392247 RepID=A0A3N4KKR4_9PEZI|nr:hypothetical protein P167DRAFT_575461 [Morchella conica CCBAS932]